MQQLRKLYSSLTAAQRIGIILATVAVVAGLLAFSRAKHQAGFKQLFTGMQAEDASSIVRKLKEAGIEYRLEDSGSTVLVPEARVDEMRLEMAGAGLPRSGRVGFELFDKTTLGVTDFAEHVNYRRALEGELERTIRSLNEVDQARVHISFPKDSVFIDNREPAKASVLLNIKPGFRLSDQNVAAVANLVASAVEGLAPETVSVVDMRGNLLNRPKRNGEQAESAERGLEYERQVEKDLISKVETTLAPLLGEDHFRIALSAECDLATTEQTDEVFDPTKSVMASSQKSEDLSNNARFAGVPGTPSNLPRPASTVPSQPQPGVAPTGSSRKSENVTFETSRSVRQVKTPRGTIKRLSASLLIDHESRIEGTGKAAKRVSVPLSAEKLKAIHEVVAGIIGFNPGRGDQLVVQSLPFEEHQLEEALPVNKSKPAAPTLSWLRDHVIEVLAASGALVVMLGGLAIFLLRRSRSKRVAADVIAKQLTEAERDRDSKVSEAQKSLASAEPSMPAISERAEQLRLGIKGAISRDPQMAAGVLKSWIAETSSK